MVCRYRKTNSLSRVRYYPQLQACTGGPEHIPVGEGRRLLCLRFTECLVVLPIMRNANWCIVVVTGKYHACFLLLILLFVFCSKLRKKSGLFYKGDPRKCRGGGVATLARHPRLKGKPHLSCLWPSPPCRPRRGAHAQAEVGQHLRAGCERRRPAAKVGGWQKFVCLCLSFYFSVTEAIQYYRRFRYIT